MPGNRCGDPFHVDVAGLDEVLVVRLRAAGGGAGHVDAGHVRLHGLRRELGHFLRAARHMEIVSVRSILRETFQLALVLGHAAYDVAFLAAAEFRDIQLVTADEKFYRKALRLTDRVVLLRNL